MLKSSHYIVIVELLYVVWMLTLVVLLFLMVCVPDRNEEIVMPAEQVGLVRDNYLWKVNNLTVFA